MVKIDEKRMREETQNNRANLLHIFKNNPLPDNEILENLQLFLHRQAYTRIKFHDELYQKILDRQGVVMEFGTRWGANIALYNTLRGMYEPFNGHRKIIGFDTFEGFLEENKDGDYSVTKGYEKYLDELMKYLENESPINHIKKYEIIKGDAPVMLDKYLKNNPATIVALAYFDMCLYSPTKECLKLLENHLVKGSIIGFSLLGYEKFPGETKAFIEEIGKVYKINRNQYSSAQTWVEID